MSLGNLSQRAGLHVDEMRALRGSSGFLLVLGILLIFLGCLAISSAFVATLATVVLIGTLLLIGGGVEAVSAFLGRGWRGFLLHLLAAVLYVILGLFMVQDPLQGAEALTLMLAAVYTAGGMVRIVYSLAEQFPGWGWVLFNGVINLILGIFIWRHWPEASLWVIGLFVGIDLLFAGWSSVMLAMGIRRLSQSAG
jgi:uncharacterized membrane protein HdeD (DUF308 family)